ncbi:hypothetical protein OPV22_022770 [Ensete ventricosum]|uniref:Uncharacterized protein n=1 Tax=Ensete ventricosum TaxID=4639 RepID=A0AAV8QP81_ENSVE|nr:hypothetical protein OPV22_022770 [Ensete ventricosum]
MTRSPQVRRTLASLQTVSSSPTKPHPPPPAQGDRRREFLQITTLSRELWRIGFLAQPSKAKSFDAVSKVSIAHIIQCVFSLQTEYVSLRKNEVTVRKRTWDQLKSFFSLDSH